MISGALLSQGRDLDALKSFGRHAVELTLKVGAKLSGIEYVKDLVELGEALNDVVRTGRTLKLRQQQARAASDLLRWADAVTLVALAWGYSAERYLVDADGLGRSTVGDDAVLERVIARMGRSGALWHAASAEHTT